MADPTQNINQAADDGAGISPSAADANVTDPVASEIEALRAESAQTREALLRAMADSENMRRRAQTDLANAHKYAIENFAVNLLPVKDTLEMALNDRASSPEQIRMGVDLTLKNLAAAFDKAKIVEVDPRSQKFDPNRHQAMSEVDSEQPPGSVVQVFQKGYMIGDRVLRPAMVAVSRAKPAGDGGAAPETARPVESKGH